MGHNRSNTDIEFAIFFIGKCSLMFFVIFHHLSSMPCPSIGLKSSLNLHWKISLFNAEFHLFPLLIPV